MKASRCVIGDTGCIIFVLTGNKRRVFMKTGLMIDSYKRLEKKIIVTDQENMDIFYNLPNTKIYPMNPETFLILKDKYYSTIISSPENI